MHVFQTKVYSITFNIKITSISPQSQTINILIIIIISTNTACTFFQTFSFRYTRLRLDTEIDTKWGCHVIYISHIDILIEVYLSLYSNSHKTSCAMFKRVLLRFRLHPQLASCPPVVIIISPSGTTPSPSESSEYRTPSGMCIYTFRRVNYTLRYVIYTLRTVFYTHKRVFYTHKRVNYT